MTTTSPPAPRPPFVSRWWTYQRERFPLVNHAPLVAVFSASAVCFSSLLRYGNGEIITWPAVPTLLTAATCCLLIFLQLRIADEFKDYKDDLQYRPYRPVQRGLVSLRELGVLFVIAGAVQLALAWAFSPRLLILLLVVWVYLALMSREFFAEAWLRARPITYLLSHMFIMPLIDLFATGCDWTTAPLGRPGSISGLALFLSASYFNGIVIEIGRKIRSPIDEERGVQTYSALWGPRIAVAAWLGAIVITGGLATAAWSHIGAGIWFPILIVLFVAATAGAGWFFLRHQTAGKGKLLELASGLWTISLYLALGIIPLCLVMFNR